MQYPENYLENQAKKLAEKAAKLEEEGGDKPKGKGKKRKNSEEADSKQIKTEKGGCGKVQNKCRHTSCHKEGRPQCQTVAASHGQRNEDEEGPC